MHTLHDFCWPSTLRLAYRSSLLLLGLMLVSATTADAEELTQAQIDAIATNYCYDCHGYGGDEGGLALDTLLESSDQTAHREAWLAVWKNLRAQAMPPSQEAQPSAEERQQFIRWIEKDVFKIDPAKPDPGRVTVRRLNREEYRNTIRDMLGVNFNVNEAFPADDTGYGFDTIGDVLSLSPLLVEKYLEAAQTIVVDAVPTDRGHKNYKQIFVDGPPSDDPQQRREYAQKILRQLADRAFRRPVDEPTLERLVDLAMYTDELPELEFEHSIRQALSAILASPRFLFRAEIQVDPNDPGQIVPIDDFALASRLSYFLWSSLPDEELYRLAKEGTLRSQLHEQVQRMLKDDRSKRFVSNFIGQWLQTRDVETLNVDARRVLGIPASEANKIFSRDVRRAMREETEMFFAHLLRENGSVRDLLYSDYTFLNEPLAKFYGIEGVKGREMRKVSLPADSPRGSLLTQGSFLLVTSNPTRTSPVKRGVFLLENVLAAPAPPPPPDVPLLEEVKRDNKKKKLTMREMMVIHRENPACATCHERMDPLGLALENFNAIGQWRETEDGQPIEAAGQLVTGESFDNVKELAKILANERRQDFYRCLTEKMFIYAIGRGVEYYDAPTIDQISEKLEQSDGAIHSLVLGIVDSPAFQMRRGDGKRHD